MKLVVIVLLLGLLRVSEQWGSGKFCSVICGTACAGNLNNQCSNSCQTDGAWSASGSTTCAPKPTWTYADSTPDYNAGTLSVSPSTTTACSDMNFYGFVTSTSSIVVSSTGILKPHFQMRIYVGIVAVDVDCWGCGGSSSYWNTGSAYFLMQFDDPQGTEVTAINPIPYKAKTSTNNKFCFDSNYREYWTRASKLYTSYNTTAALTWTITCNETNSTAKWGIREFVILVRGCHPACLECYGTAASQCYSCTQNTTIYWLSNNTCNETCLYRFGEAYPYVCVYCDLHCTACYGVFDNCSACTASGTWASFLYVSLTGTPAYPTCINPCPDGYFANKTSRTCDPCNTNCSTCINSPTYCTSCAAGYYWTGWFCYNPCPAHYFLDPNGINCTQCLPFCIECIGANNVCTSCTLTGQYVAYLYNATALTGTCERICPTTPPYYAETFGGAGPNLCLPCHANCTICTGNPTPCSQCITGLFLLGVNCTDVCPNGTIASTATGTGICLDCSVYCVGLTINMYFPSVVNDKVYIDMVFSQDIDFTTFAWQTFQTINITSKNLQYTADMFTWTYSLLGTSSYRIAIEPKTYIFLYNATFTVTTNAQPATLDTSIALMPFKTSNYLKSAALTWFLIKGPPFTSLEVGIMSSFSKLSANINNLLTKPYAQELKKSGVFNLLFSGAQVTSFSMLSNQIQSQNLYEGVRLFGTFVFFDAPPYEQISDKTKRFVAPTVEDQIRNAQEVAECSSGQGLSWSSGAGRALFSTDNMYWRFQRTGQTSFFIYDVYVPMFLLAACWVAVGVAACSRKKRWFDAYAAHIYAGVHRVHEMALMYITMASIVEFIYFEPTSAQRFISAIICIVFNLYFVAYELYIYYDMIKYPLAEIGNKTYDYYVVRYGYFLKNVRYEEYDFQEEWSATQWFRPYNYHLLSYYKKFLMVVSLPLFYSVIYAQMGVLFTLQLLEIVRFCKTWPFTSQKRNYFRLSLEFSLLFFFFINLIQITLLQTIMSGDTSTLESTTKVFYGLGWAGFAACFYFNISFICINVYDFCVSLRANNRARMDDARKRYYFQKIRDYEKDNEASSKDLVSRWVKLGNLNDKAYGELPEVNVRLELYEIRKVGNKFEVAIKKITRLQMRANSKLRKANHTTVGGKIERSLVLCPADNSRLFSVINDVYKTFEGPHVETIRLKTFLNVWQKDYEEGQEIPLNRNLMFQRVELISYDNEVTNQSLDALLDDFPLDEAIINNAL